MAIYPFLTFNGNCREAMRFYQSCFGGELHFITLGEAQAGCALPQEMQALIVQASLVSDHIRLFASDLGNEEGLYAGNSISLFISMSKEERLDRVFKKLAKHGDVTAPLTADIQHGQWATLTDRYAVQWIFEVAGSV